MNERILSVRGEDEHGNRRLICSGTLCRVTYYALDEYDEPHPMRGVKVRVLEYVGYSKSGHDCTVEVLASPEELAARFIVRYGELTTVEQIRDMFHRDMYAPELYDIHEKMSPDHLYCEFETKDLIVIDES